MKLGLGLAVRSSFVLAALLAAAGCSANAGDGGAEDGANGAVTGSGDTTAAAGGDAVGSFATGDAPAAPASTSTGNGNGGTPSSAGDVGNVTPGSACATSTAAVVVPPVHLVFMIDRSGSMGNSQQGQNASVRWQPVVSGLDSFFADKANTKVSASVSFFSQGKGQTECNSATYATPAVAMSDLGGDASAFSSALSAAQPGGGTPTKPALEGAIAYAQQVKASVPADEKVAIVLATDGEPNDCSSTPENVAAAAATVASSIPTYVIGVGPDTGNLDAIAAGGGTSKAIMIATSNPAQVSADLRAAVGQIKAEQLGCDYVLPAPPSGQTLDVNAVNVDYTPAGGAAQTLPYSADCSDPKGWHYDDAKAPKKIVMCASSCSTLQADATGGKVDIVFGCAIETPPGSDLPGGGIK